MHSDQPDPCVGLVDTNAVKPLKRQISIENFRQNLARVVLLLLVVVCFGCRTDGGPANAGADGGGSAATGGSEGGSLTCPECELVEVIEVVDANTVRTSISDIGMYGAYVLDQPADCAALAMERLSVLVGGSGGFIRIESGPEDTVRSDPNHYYLYTADGLSIDEQLVREGLALVWTQDGQHLGWFVFRDADARENEAGCLWKGWRAFQRGESGEFRIPGLTYPDER